MADSETMGAGAPAADRPRTPLAARLETPRRAGAEPRLVLIGNPNVGKSVLFGLLTGRYATVSNYPGTTVEVSTGSSAGIHPPRQVVDTPGANSLLPQSEDEKVARDILLEEGDVVVVQVGDAKNLRRALALTVQLAETGRPCVLCLNMIDEARERDIHVDAAALERELGVPVVCTSGIRKVGIDDLRAALARARPVRPRVDYGAEIEAAAAEIEPWLDGAPIAPRALALSVLAGDRSLGPWLRERLDRDALQRIDEARRALAVRFGDPVGYVLQRRRQAEADRLAARVSTAPPRRDVGFGAALGRWTMHPVWGLPFLVAVLAVAYVFVGQFGAGTLVDWIEGSLFNRYVNPAAIGLVDAVAPFAHTHAVTEGVVAPTYTLDGGAPTGWAAFARVVHDFLVGDYGIVTMALTYAIAIVLPVVGTFFLFFGLIEDSGYLPRLTVMVDRLFRLIGLNGKAVLPMVLGLGCDTMATLTTRILESKKERIVVTLLLALAIPCSAQLGVLLGMLAGISLWGTVVWSGVVVGSIFVAGFLARFVVSGRSSDFVMELPPVRRPKLVNIVVKTLGRMEWYLREAVPLFILGTVLLFALDLSGLLATLIALGEPVVTGWLGLPGEATQAFLIGFLRRDYGAAGLLAMQRAGELDAAQVVVALTVITLFVPCVANFFMMWKERGLRATLIMVAFIVPYAFVAGAFVRWLIEALSIPL